MYCGEKKNGQNKNTKYVNKLKQFVRNNQKLLGEHASRYVYFYCETSGFKFFM